ncbi:MAG: hypothetical protein R2741_15235 [Methanolobus sp.]
MVSSTTSSWRIWSEQVAQLHEMGKKVILVSSGAIGIGIDIL